MARLKLEYWSPEPLIIEDLVPTKQCIPDWYKQIPTKDNNGEDLTVKHCVPFIDAFQTGYVILSSQDFKVENKEIFWKINDQEKLVWVNLRKSPSHLPAPQGYENLPFTWVLPFSIKLPKGYSAIVTHPLNRFDLPFITTSAVVDYDSGIHNGQFPFFLKEDFEGIIPAGTPLCQIIPFERKKWTRSFTPELEKLKAKFYFLRNRVYSNGFYKKTMWEKKHYD